MPPLRRILHIDMDAFYASVEQREQPALRGRPVVVGGDPRKRGVVAAASYEARAFGVRSAMPMSTAVRLCPALTVVPPDFTKYRAVSQQVFALFRAVTPLVEPLSLDEAYLDVTENAWGEPLGVTVAKRLKAQIRDVTGLTASAGVAPNKFLAKIASGWQKPDGLTVIAPERMEQFLRGLPVDALWGVGPVTAARLRQRGIEKLVDVRSADPAALREAVGSHAAWLLRMAHGEDDRPVVSEHAPKSAGSERTYDVDLTDLEVMRDELRRMASKASRWLHQRDLYARTLTIKVRYADFTTITRSHTAAPSRDEARFAETALTLLGKTSANARPVRLLGVSVQNLSSSTEPPPRGGPARLPFGE